MHWKLQQDKIDMEQQHPQLKVRLKQQRQVEINRQDWEKIHQQYYLRDAIEDEIHVVSCITIEKTNCIL